MNILLTRRQLIARTTHASLALAAIGMSHALVSSAEDTANKADSAPLKNATPRQVAESYWRVECARNLEAIGRHYHFDAVFSPPGEHLVGWDNIKKWYERSFRRYPGLEVEIAHEIRNGNEASLEWRAVLIDTAGVRHPLTGVNIVRVEDGKFHEVRAYFDPSALM